MPRKKMTQKQALGVLHKAKVFLYHSEQYRKDETLREEVMDAFEVLARAIHGKPPTCSTLLCGRCHLAYGTAWIEYYEEEYQFNTHEKVCSSCLEHCKKTLALIGIDGKPYHADENISASPVAIVPVERAS